MFTPTVTSLKSPTLESSSFTLSSNQRKFQILKSIPKFNSHCHLGGEIPIDTLIKYANSDQMKALENAMAEIAIGKEYEKAFFVFPLISQIINTHEKLKEATSRTCEQLKSDNNQLVFNENRS